MNVRGKRILIRAIELEDLPLIHAWFNDPDLAVGLGDVHFPTSRVAQQRWYEKAIESEQHTVRLAVEDEEKKCIGMTGFWNIHWRDRRAEHALIIGAKARRGMGYGQETIATCARYAFEEMGLFRLDATVLATNVASQRVYQTCAFQVEGTQRAHAIRNGKRVDRLILGLLEAEYVAWAQRTGYWCGQEEG